ncbi:MAG: M23 family metallopeptidase, partial [Chloroflexi bacterium]
YVDTGALLGTVGSTGNSTGPHLHFEIRRDGVLEDPRADVTLP